MPRRKIRRKTHICPNCETVLEREENYCHVCGQENHNLNVPMKDLLMEVIGSFTFFETKFIETAKIIFTHPGKLTLDFNSGKRAKYMHPVRMYFWVSAIFFFTVSLTKSENNSKPWKRPNGKETPKISQSRKAGRTLVSVITGREVNDTVNIETEIKQASPKKSFNNGREFGKKLYRKQNGIKSDEIKKDTNIIEFGMYEHLKISRDSVEYYYNLSENKFDSTLVKKGISSFYSNKRFIKFGLEDEYNSFLEKKYGIPKKNNGSSNFVSALPNIIFLILPFAALILYFFERHTKWKFYFQHLVFTLNTHSAIFLMWTISEIFENTIEYFWNTELGNDFFSFFPLGLGLLYFFISLKKVYLQGWGKTSLKFILLTFSYIVTFFFLMIGVFFTGLIRI